jgi:hypothetical protein
MPFTAEELRNQIAFALDAEGSDHYRDEQDYIPAINASMNWLVTVINSAIGKDKIGEEFFRDISYSGVFKTDDCSRVSLNVFPEELWSVLAIYVKPEVKDLGTQAPDTSDKTNSYFMENLLHKSSYLSCKRLSVEEWATARSNPFEDGYDGDQLCDALKSYAYLNPFNYQNTNSGLTAKELEIRPSIPNEDVTIFWVKKPSEIVNITDVVEFPNSVFQLLFDKALSYIAYKQGDQTNLHGVSEQDISLLLSVI